MSKRRLGRGLNALISTPDSNLVEGDDSQIKKINLDSIEPNPYQPRKTFNQEELEELTHSIKEHGLIQPIIVRKAKSGSGYQIVAGERRYRASKNLNLKEIDAIITDIDEQQMMEIALIENLQRKDLNPIEEAEAYQQLIDTFNLVQAELAKRVGKSRSSIANSLRLLKLPDKIKEYVSRGTLAMGHARTLLAIEDIDLQKEVANQIIEKELSVRETERLIKGLKNKTSESKSKKKAVTKKDPNVTIVEERLRGILGTKVAIQSGKKKGKIVIEYYSNDDLFRIIEVLDK
ncbi:chromosome partitioning protein ParB [Orenia metallireducens]|uniref:Chromosome partitioning protein ParB n=1 Tax=Orenia metallireducens TaxID=1413210 RepID=A0A1C0ACS8_9FIRM|nr:ParB/RepB/Spo0J family partition protein [Orenia metallireducens]OCL28448.1 chromosome partitioning protein ParB [Orenia metallireducens]